MVEHKILIVDDELDMLNLLKRTLEPDLNCRVETVSSGKEALRRIGEESFDLVLADIKMPEMDGLELLSLIKKEVPDLTLVMMTGHGSIETAVASMRQGAYDYITKPFDHDALMLRLEKALERSSLLKENIRLLKQSASENEFQDLVGKSAAMQRVFETIHMVAGTDLTVLITGESGVGKDLIARSVHKLSLRRKGPYVAVNCPTVPEQILESELFGYRKGAFTHATQNRIGLFQEAEHGTLFLDEIGDISPTIQTKLLRALQEKEIKPLGDTRTLKVDVRIIASTNQNLQEKMKTGQFREDFFYRLNVLPIKVPPLRERIEDIPLIINHLLQKHCPKLNKPMKCISPELMEIFMKRSWEGNIRELENIVVQGILFSRSDEILPQDVGLSPPGSGQICLGKDNYGDLSYKEAKEEILKQFNSAYIGRVLARHHGNVTQAARLCGMERQALQQIIRRYGINADMYREDG
ncbi:MAG: sigma-54-dependent Fis family transcriptional regulator [Desulfobacteraceae bacterium]|nr:MAG: sigma-54-dependent Fis family transcriptional regulator [Desulfobacteraceae bacterium]